MLGLKIRKYFLLLLFGALVFLTLNKNSKSNPQEGSYQTEIWADKSGYYIYLPHFIINGGNSDLLAEGIDIRTGNGFKLEDDKMKSKFMMGVAIMQAPFFVIAHINAKLIYDNPTGFEKVYANWMGVGAVFYLLLGLYFVFSLSRLFLDEKWALVVVVASLLGTNLLFYGIDDTLMTHVYSFALISFLLYLNIKAKLKKGAIELPGVYILVVSLCLMLRPTSLFFLLIITLFFWEVILKTLQNLKWIRILPFLFFSLLIMGIQVAYWKYTYGTLYPSGYDGESFEYLTNPAIAKTLFAPNNGWLVYSPVFGIGVIVCLLGFKKLENLKPYFLLSVFVAVVYVYITASWWCYDFGCGFGARNMVDFTAVFVLFLTGAFVILKREFHKKILTFGLLSLSLLNTWVMYHYDNCWFGLSDWDWNTYMNFI